MGPDTVVRREASAGTTAARFSVSVDGGVRFTEFRDHDVRLHLRLGAFDPLAATRPELPAVLAATGRERLVIVQFKTQSLSAYRSALAELGVDVLHHLPATAVIARGSDEALAAIADLAFVRHLEPLAPGHRLEPMLVDAIAADAQLAPARYVIRVADPAAGDHDRVAAAVEAAGGRVDRRRAGKLLLEATLTSDQLVAVAADDAVLFIDRWSGFESDMDVVRQASGSNFVNAVGGYTGQGVRGEVMDAGFNLDHVDFAGSLLLRGSSGVDSHGASTSGIVFGRGIGDPSARGLLPDAQGIVSSYQNGFISGRVRYDHTAELVEPEWQATFQSCSFGTQRTTDYTNFSAEMDQILFDFDIVICQSQSNAGTTSSRPEAWAKNVIAVGGVRHQETVSRADDAWAGSASIGPASDGRIKPDLVHFYEAIHTVSAASETSYTETFGGTSAATPIVAGHVGLLQQMWADGIFGNEVDGSGDVWNNRAAATTIRALLINTAVPYDWTNGGPNGDITRVRQGWGLPDLERIWNARARMLVVDENDVLPELSVRSTEIEVAPGQSDLRVTLAWRDPPGVSSAAIHRVNDLDLRVVAPNGTVYRGNHGLMSDVWSVANGPRDSINTVENVFLPNPAPGTWTVTVEVQELNADGHPETSAADTTYSLVASGAEAVPVPLVLQPTSARPRLVPPNTSLLVRVDAADGTEQLEGITLRHRVGSSGPFSDLQMTPSGSKPNEYEALLPPAPCFSHPEYYIVANGTGGTEVRWPPNAPVAVARYQIGTEETLIYESFETAVGWTVTSDALEDGAWEVGVPVGGGDRGDPGDDFDGSGACWLTDNEDGNSDVDGGPTRLTSPIYDVSGAADPRVSFARWFTDDDESTDGDSFRTELSNNGGSSWATIEVAGVSAGWTNVSFRIADYMTPTANMRIRFTVTDNPNNSIVEAGLDALTFTSIECTANGSRSADVNGDGVVNFGDLVLVLANFGPCTPGVFCSSDLDSDGEVDFTDVILVIGNWSA
ncbi:MAG: S8 family serine peptidase [Phycisphaerales bacterium]